MAEMCILYEIKLNFGMARCQVVKMWCTIKLHQPQFNSICLIAPLYFTLSVIDAEKPRHKKNIPVCNVDKPTTEEWTRGRHWHQTDTTEINRHKRSSQKKKKKNTEHTELAWAWTRFITLCLPQAKNSKANRFKKGNGRGARSMCGLGTGGTNHASSVSSKLLGIFIHIYIMLFLMSCANNYLQKTINRYLALCL